MNVEFNLILLKDQDKTADIESCNYVDGKYHIIFLNNSQIYKYAYSSVKWFKSPEHLNPDNFRFTHRGQNIYDIKRILQFDDYIRFIFKSGDFKTYSILELRIERNCLAESASINCLNYFKSVAASTGIRSEDGQTLLNNQLEKLTFINNETALATYMTQRIFERKPEKSNGYYYPFGHNLSQIEAIKSAMENQISVIEGPPGTGKTQTILNIIANLVIRGLTVAVVSNNNSATSNVLEKLQQTGFDFIAAPLGRSENRKAFIEFQSGRYPDLSSFQFSNDEIQPIRQNLALLEKDSKEVLHLKNEIAELKNKLSELDIERQHYNK